MLTTARNAERTATSSAFRVQTAQQSARRTLVERFTGAPARHLGRGESLFAEGDTKSHVYKVESGSVLMSNMLKSGRRQVISFAFPGEYIGLISDRLHAFDARTTSAAKIRCVPVPSLRRWIWEESTVADELHAAISKEFAQLQAHFLTIGRRDANGRIATFLLTLADRSAGNGLGPDEIYLPMLRSDIADFVCLSVETVSRALTELKNAKMITLKGARLITVIDRKALTRLTYAE